MPTASRSAADEDGGRPPGEGLQPLMRTDAAPTLKPRAVGYVRAAASTEGTRSADAQVQERAVREYCKARGVALVEIYHDEGVGALGPSDLPVGLAAALFRIASDQIPELVVARLDRVSRSLVAQESICTALHRQGVTVTSVSESVPESLSEKGIVRQFVGALAAYERATMGARLRAGKNAKKLEGGYVGGRPGFGYAADGGLIFEDPVEQAVLATIHRYRQMGRSYAEIAVLLNREGIPSKMGKKWVSQTVRRPIVRRQTAFIEALRAEGASLEEIAARLSEEGFMPSHGSSWTAKALRAVLDHMDGKPRRRRRRRTAADEKPEDRGGRDAAEDSHAS